MKIEVYAHSEVGSNNNYGDYGNSDNFFILDPVDNTFVKGNGEASDSAFLEFETSGPVWLAVSDGVRADSAGRSICRSKIESLLKSSTTAANRPQDELSHLRNLLSAMVELDAELLEYNLSVRKDLRLFEVFTDLTTAVIDDGKLHVLHLGENRLFLVRRQKIYRITKDQSFTQMLIEAGQLTEEEARHSIIEPGGVWYVLGTDAHSSRAMAASVFDLENEDILVLCTCGFSYPRYSSYSEKSLDEKEILEIIEQTNDNISTAGKGLVDAVNGKAGWIDRTVIIAKIYDEKLAASESGEPQVESIVLTSLDPHIYDIYEQSESN